MNYSGWELKYFDLSQNFRKYQYELIKNYLGDRILEAGPGSGKFAKNFLLKNKLGHLQRPNLLLF